MSVIRSFLRRFVTLVKVLWRENTEVSLKRGMQFYVGCLTLINLIFL